MPICGLHDGARAKMTPVFHKHPAGKYRDFVQKKSSVIWLSGRCQVAGFDK